VSADEGRREEALMTTIPDRDEPDAIPIGNRYRPPRDPLAVHNQAVTSQPARQRC